MSLILLPSDLAALFIKMSTLPYSRKTWAHISSTALPSLMSHYMYLTLDSFLAIKFCFNTKKLTFKEISPYIHNDDLTFALLHLFDHALAKTLRSSRYQNYLVLSQMESLSWEEIVNKRYSYYYESYLDYHVYYFTKISIRQMV